jgi:hypothetical protein
MRDQFTALSGYSTVVILIISVPSCLMRETIKVFLSMEFFFQRLADATFFLFQKRTTSLLSTSIRVLIKYFYMK